MGALSRVILAQADAWSIEKRFIRKNGRVIWVRVNGAVVRDDTGKAVRIVAMITRVAPKKRKNPKPPDQPPNRKR
jgi:PAS domain S-box-containing protein